MTLTPSWAHTEPAAATHTQSDRFHLHTSSDFLVLMGCGSTDLPDSAGTRPSGGTPWKLTTASLDTPRLIAGPRSRAEDSPTRHRAAPHATGLPFPAVLATGKSRGRGRRGCGGAQARQAVHLTQQGSRKAPAHSSDRGLTPGTLNKEPQRNSQDGRQVSAAAPGTRRPAPSSPCPAAGPPPTGRTPPQLSPSSCRDRTPEAAPRVLPPTQGEETQRHPGPKGGKVSHVSRGHCSDVGRWSMGSHLHRPCGLQPAGSPHGIHSGQGPRAPGTCACSRHSHPHTGFSLQLRTPREGEREGKGQVGTAGS